MLRWAHLVIARWRSLMSQQRNEPLVGRITGGNFMEYFRFDHPPDRLTLCIRSNCEEIADYLEVNEEGREDFVCAGHTSSERHASVLPKGVPSAVPHGGVSEPDFL